MKKITFIFLATLVLQSVSAQLKNTRWEGAIKGDNPRNAILDFKKDTLILYASNNEVIEVMTYSITGKTLTIKKINGQSDCDNMVVGKYAVGITGDKSSVKLIDDPCYDRSSALDATSWTKQKGRKKIKGNILAN